MERAHGLEAGGLRLRYGTLAGGRIPYEVIESVELSRRRTLGGDGLRVVAGEKAAYLAIGGRTDVRLQLREPLPLQGALNPTPPVTTVHFAADTPERLVEALVERLGKEPDTG